MKHDLETRRGLVSSPPEPVAVAPMPSPTKPPIHRRSKRFCPSPPHPQDAVRPFSGPRCRTTILRATLIVAFTPTATMASSRKTSGSHHTSSSMATPVAMLHHRNHHNKSSSMDTMVAMLHHHHHHRHSSSSIMAITVAMLRRHKHLKSSSNMATTVAMLQLHNNSNINNSTAATTMLANQKGLPAWIPRGRSPGKHNRLRKRPTMRRTTRPWRSMRLSEQPRGMANQEDLLAWIPRGGSPGKHNRFRKKPTMRCSRRPWRSMTLSEQPGRKLRGLGVLTSTSHRLRVHTINQEARRQTFQSRRTTNHRDRRAIKHRRLIKTSIKLPL